jgi:hypothetical protein
VTLGVAVATCWGASSLTGQAGTDLKESRVWGFQGLRTGYCVRFLIEPRAASRKLREGFRLVRADRDTTLHPALRQTIQMQPEFGPWSPSSLCFYFTDAVQVGARRVGEKDSRKSQLVAAWTLATLEERGNARRDLALGLYGSRGGLIRAAEATGVRLREAETSVADRADTTDTYSVKLEGTLLIWRGQPTGDSTRVERPIQESWLVSGLRGGVWAAALTLSPSWSRPLVGSLTVEGKGDLAKALKASPIRFVGPLHHGGGGELRFSR